MNIGMQKWITHTLKRWHWPLGSDMTYVCMHVAASLFIGKTVIDYNHYTMY